MALISFVLSLNPARDGSCDLNPPLECNVGSELILRVDPGLTTDGTGIIVATIIDTSFSSGLFHYVLEYDDSLVTQPLVQADVIETCCMNCISRFAQAIGGAAGSMVDNGNYASGATDIQYNDGFGNTFDFAEGFQTVKTTAFGVCPIDDVGVGIQRMVRGVSIVGDELIVDAAPEHHTFGTDIKTAEVPLATDISGLGTFVLVGFGNVFLANDCRGIFSLTDYYGYAKVVLSPGGSWNLTLDVSVDGGPFATIWTHTYGPSTAFRSETWFISSYGLEQVPPQTFSFGTTVLLTVTTLVPSVAGSTVTAARVAMGQIDATQEIE